MWLLISIHIVKSDGKGSTKNKFELDRLDHDSYVNRLERYSVQIFRINILSSSIQKIVLF